MKFWFIIPPPIHKFTEPPPCDAICQAYINYKNSVFLPWMFCFILFILICIGWIYYWDTTICYKFHHSPALK